MKVIAWDSETHRFSEGNLLPPMVCFSAAWRHDGDVQSEVVGNHPDETQADKLEALLDNEEYILVTQNGGFDYGVAMATYPHLTTKIWDAMYAGRATDTMWREKLLNLSTTGKLSDLIMPDGSVIKKGIRYGLSDLMVNYYGIDRSADKEGEDIWRINYNVLDGWHSSEYPDEAYGYAAQDAEDTLRVYEAQERRAKEQGGSLVTQEFTLLSSFALQLKGAWGMKVNHENTDALEIAVNESLEANRDLLEGAGILRTATHGEPHKKDFERACKMLPSEYEPGMCWMPYVDSMMKAGIKFKAPKAKPGSMDTKKLQVYVKALYHRLGEIPTETPSGAICLEAEIKEYLATKDPLMHQLNEREALKKLTSQMIPILRSGDVIHPTYNALLETGRTSCYDGGKAKKGGDGVRLYPGGNLQQVPNMIRGLDPRRCFEPRPGKVFFDVDATGLELAAIGFTTDQLFGESLHLELYNQGVDLHAYLGSNLAVMTDVDMAAEFVQECRKEGILSDPMAVYQAYKGLSSHDDKEVKGFYGAYRKFAKPVGLGFPGGLGAATMVEFARKTYGVVMTERQAEEFKEMWLNTYPEMPKAFEWVSQQVDEYNTGQSFKFGRPEVLHTYKSPLGMVRRGATFCAGANGMFMQTPGAEAAKTGAIWVSRACYDPSLESVLYGCRPIAFVHDQIIGETTDDPEMWAPQCEEVARLFREGMMQVLHTVKMRTDEALLTTEWTKSAEPVRNAQGVLIPYVPS